MSPSSTAYHADLEKDVSSYLDRIRQIDRILQRPVNTLIKVSHEAVLQAGDFPTGRQLDFPGLLSGQAEPMRSYNPLTQALCFSTLQRLGRRRRRFSWLQKNKQLLELLGNPAPRGTGDVPNRLLGCFMPPEKSGAAGAIALLQSDVFGPLNPYTAAQVFRVLVEGGEAHTHSGVGCLAFFTMVWPLYREFPDTHNRGARIEPWNPTAYVTANCLLPILGVMSIATRRGHILEAIAQNLEGLNELTSLSDPRSQWRFNVQLDALSANLLRLSEVAIVKERFAKCANEVATLSGDLRADGKIDSYKQVFAAVLAKLSSALREAGKRAEDTLKEAQDAVSYIVQIIPKIENLDENNPEDLLSAFRSLERAWGLRFAQEYILDTTCRKDYLKDVLGAAMKAMNLSHDLLKALAEAAALCGKCENDFQTVHTTLLSLAKTNHRVAKRLHDPVDAPARWCRSVIDREIAHASAGNLTEFDPSELVSAIAVAVRCKLIPTSLQVTDAISKAILGVQQDGSWRPGRPFYSPDDALGIWPDTSDIVWTLTSSIEQQPEVNVADEKLFLFVDWLERTLIELPVRRPVHTDQHPQRWAGWPSDRLRHQFKIDLATTAYSVNALLEIRDLVEYRLWELCQRRFATPSVTIKGFEDVEPVDLGAIHHHRLHNRLARIARQAQNADDDAAYSLVLHGPPGSSKTRLAEALSVEMWKTSRPWGSGGPRLIRVTPADFTRLGEDRIDSEARLIFDLLGHVRAVTILFDEIDDLLRRRNPNLPTRFMDLVVPAMLNRLADLRDICPRHEVCFLLATNYIESIERALIRKGRIDHAVAVVYPDEISRYAMVHRHLQVRGPKANDDIREIIDQFVIHTKGWPWMTIDDACKEMVRQLLANKVINRNQAQFSPPHYKPRLRQDKTRSPELRDEYMHYIICSCADSDDLYKEKSAIEALCNRWDISIEEFQTHLQKIIADEGRVRNLSMPEDMVARPGDVPVTKDAADIKGEIQEVAKPGSGVSSPADVATKGGSDKGGDKPVEAP